MEKEYIIQAKDNNSCIKSIQLKNNIVLSRQTASHMAFIGNFISSGFRIETDGKVIYIDPYKVTEEKPADYIFITHAHPDHLSIPDIKKIVKKDTVIVCPHKAADKLGGYMIREVKPGDTFSFGAISFETIAAYYTKRLFLIINSHPQIDMNVGYILDINGVRFYHMGDTHLIPEMKNIKDIDVAMVPIGVGTMTQENAVDVINMLNPSIAVPMHYSVEKADIRYLKQFCKPNVEIITFDD